MEFSIQMEPFEKKMQQISLILETFPNWRMNIKIFTKLWMARKTLHFPNPLWSRDSNLLWKLELLYIEVMMLWMIKWWFWSIFRWFCQYLCKSNSILHLIILKIFIGSNKKCDSQLAIGDSKFTFIYRNFKVGDQLENIHSFFKKS